MLIDHGETPLQKGDEYILFLKLTTSGSGHCVMSGSTGKINLTNPKYNKNGEIEFKFLLDYEAKEQNDIIEKILPLEAVGDKAGSFEQFENITIPTNYGDIHIAKAVTDDENNIYMELNMGSEADGTYRSVTFANFRFND